MSGDATNLWGRAEHALAYLERADGIPHRLEGEAALLECLPADSRRVLDLGSGDGRLLAAVMRRSPAAAGVAVDFSGTMLAKLRERFGGDEPVRVVAHDLAEPLPDLGSFDVIVSCFAIHHLADERKRALYAEIFERLTPGGVFCNLEHVASATPTLHHQFLATLGVRPEDEDPSNKLLDVHTQLEWLRAIGFADVDCHWKWRELPPSPASARARRSLVAPRHRRAAPWRLRTLAPGTLAPWHLGTLSIVRYPLTSPLRRLRRHLPINSRSAGLV